MAGTWIDHARRGMVARLVSRVTLTGLRVVMVFAIMTLMVAVVHLGKSVVLGYGVFFFFFFFKPMRVLIAVAVPAAAGCFC